MNSKHYVCHKLLPEKLPNVELLIKYYQYNLRPATEQQVMLDSQQATKSCVESLVFKLSLL